VQTDSYRGIICPGLAQRHQALFGLGALFALSCRISWLCDGITVRPLPARHSPLTQTADNATTAERDHEQPEFHINDVALGTVSGGVSRHGAEVNMIEVQSLVSQRAMAIQTTTGLIRSINDSTKTVAGNIGR
jgi:hypothetical protein